MASIPILPPGPNQAQPTVGRTALKPGTGTAFTPFAVALLLASAPVAAHAEAKDGAASLLDLDFVRRVHTTVLGVTPAAELARDSSAAAGVKSLAAQVDTQDAKLDTLARSTAAALKLALTDPLPGDEQAALATLRQHTGSVFDARFVNFLWSLDSTLLPVATTARATTKNAAVRKLAERAEAITTGQLPLLQRSGLLQTAVTTPASASASAKLPGGVPYNQDLMAKARSGDGSFMATFPVRLGVLATALVVVLALTWRLRTRARRPRHSAEVYPVGVTRRPSSTSSR
jgi:putative membrane protein